VAAMLAVIVIVTVFVFVFVLVVVIVTAVVMVTMVAVVPARMVMIVCVIAAMVVPTRTGGGVEARQFDVHVDSAIGGIGQQQPVAGFQPLARSRQPRGLFVAARRVLEADQVGAGHLQHQVQPAGLDGELAGGQRMHVGVRAAYLGLGRRQRDQGKQQRRKSAHVGMSAGA